jgi:hypothetical protein
MSKKLYGLLLPVFVVALMASAAPAFAAHEWKPVGGFPYAVSTNLSFTIASGPTLTCRTVTAEPTEAGYAMSGTEKTWPALPVFGSCTAPATGKGVWKVIDETSALVGLEVPKEGVVVTLSGTCTVTVAPTAAETLTNMKWNNGSTALTLPSTWEISGKTVTIKESSANCSGSTVVGGATTATVTATFAVLNLQFRGTKAIEAT